MLKLLLPTAALVLTTLLPGAAVQAAPADGALTWSVAPAGPRGPNGRPALQYKLDPGATVTDHVAVTNHSQRPLTLRLYASDAFTTASGGFDIKAGGTRPTDVGAWVKVSRSTVDVPAGSQVVVPLTIAVPGNATPGDHVGGVVASLSENRASAGGSQVTVDHRVGTRLYLRVTGPLRPELTVVEPAITTSASWNPLSLPSLTSEFTVRNTGNVRLVAQPSARTHGVAGLGERTAAADPTAEILPGGEVTIRLRTGGVLPLFRVWHEIAVQPAAVGDVTLDPAPAQASLRSAHWLMPWPQLALLAVLAAVTALAILLRRRRRGRLTAALAEAERRGREQARHEEPAKGRA